jgi:hypothetical protein
MGHAREVMKRFLISVVCLFILLMPAMAQQYGTRTLSIVGHTTSGFVKGGCFGLTFISSSGFTGTVAGYTLAASTTLAIPIPAQSTLGDTYYTVTAGTLYSLEIR